MSRDVFRYEFSEAVPMDEVEASLVLALFAAESLHGEARLKLDSGHAFDAGRRRCVIEATGQPGQDLNAIFCGFLAREFEPSDFTVERVENGRQPDPEAVAATA